MRLLKILIVLAVGAVMAWLVLLNPDLVLVHLDPFRLGIIPNSPVELPLWAVMIGSGLVGFLFGVLMEWDRESGVRRDRAGLERKVRSLEARLAEQEMSGDNLADLLDPKKR